jgi:hypothetical protein
MAKEKKKKIGIFHTKLLTLLRQYLYLTHISINHSTMTIEVLILLLSTLLFSAGSLYEEKNNHVVDG